MKTRTKQKHFIKTPAFFLAFVFLFAGGFFSFAVNFLLAANSLIPKGIFSARAETDIQSFAGGDGGEKAPYLISAPEQLDGLRQFCGGENRDKNFKLINDIDLTAYLSEGGAGHDGGAGWKPIGGDGEDEFYGNLDGGGFTVRGLWIDRPDAYGAGFFGFLIDARIKNLRIVLDPVKGIKGGHYTGGLAACVRESENVASKIEKCSVTGGVLSVGDSSGDFFLGGLFGDVADYIVSECAFTGSVTFKTQKEGSGRVGVGGIAGVVGNGTIKNCYVDVVPEAGSCVPAGVAGTYVLANEAVNCFVSLSGGGDVFPFFGSPTGFMGQQMATVTNCRYYNVDGVPREFGEYDYPHDVDALSKRLMGADIKSRSAFAGWDFDNVWGFDRDGNLGLRAFGTPSVTLAVYKDGAVWLDCGKAFTLKNETATPQTFGSGNDVHAAVAANGAWAVYDGGTDTGAAINLYGAHEVVTLQYYTVTFSVTDAGKAGGSTVTAVYGGEPIDSGAVVLGGKTLTLTVTENGAGKKIEYTRLWSGLDLDAGDAARKTVTVNNLSGAVNIAVTVTGTIPPPNLTWLWIALAVLIAGAAAGAVGLYFYRRKQPRTITETVTETAYVEREIIKEVPLSRGEPLPMDMFTPAERRIAPLLALGKSRREIAEELGIAENTVRNHTSNILDKAEVDSQKAFIAKYIYEKDFFENS
ncbi:hypothetical protein FACS1894211_10640 [Clostridia bacterium]|nr:hypothetical protein FACS1894211_10640 [Clostridia bacterium]